MTVRLEDQIRDYAFDVHETEMPLTVDEIMEMRLGMERVQLLDTQIRRPVPGWVAAVTAAAVVILFGGVAFLLFDSGGAGAPAATTPPTVAPKTVVPATASPVIAGWSRVSNDGGVFGGPDRQEMADVIVAGPGFVAVGTDSEDAAVWTSVDGSLWSRVPHDETVFGNGSMSSVIASGPVVVAVGEGEVRWAGESRAGSAVVWTSPDGISWTRVADDENVFGDALMADVTVGGPGFVAVGSTNRHDGRDAAVWTSVDGISWSRVAHDESVFGGENKQSMNSVAAGGPGLVAVGYDGTHSWDNPLGSAAVWTSVDGLVWSRVHHDESVFGYNTAMVSVTAGGPGVVAVGYAFNCSPVWTSVDGLVWSRVPHDVPGACNRPMRSVIADGEHLVAVGHDASSWSSVDGVTWILNSDDPRRQGNQWMHSVTTSDAGLVAVGFIQTDDGSEQGDEPVRIDADGDPIPRFDAAVWLQE